MLILNGLSFPYADLEGAKFGHTHLEHAELSGARLARSASLETHFERARLYDADLRGSRHTAAHLDGATFINARVDGGTLITRCSINEDTDFSNVGLDAMRRSGPGLKVALQYNRRKKNWKEWYGRHRIKALFVRPFWWISDYGQSMGRIASVFLIFSVLFALIYWGWALIEKGDTTSPGIVSDLVIPGDNEAETLVRSLYFSIVTMTTLGFGDMHAQAGRLAGPHPTHRPGSPGLLPARRLDHPPGDHVHQRRPHRPHGHDGAQKPPVIPWFPWARSYVLTLGSLPCIFKGDLSKYKDAETPNVSRRVGVHHDCIRDFF